MSDREEDIEEARSLLNDAIEACNRLNRLDKEILSEIAKNRIKWPITIIGTKGKIGSGKKAEEYVHDLGLGSNVPVKADLPKAGLKSYILNYIDWVYSLRELRELVKPDVIVPEDFIEVGLIGEYHEWAERDWLQKQRAFRLPELNPETVKQWADHIADLIIYEAYEHGDEEVIELLGKEQLVNLGFPKEIQCRAVTNYKKLLDRNLRRAEDRAKAESEKSSFEGMEDHWKGLFAQNAKSKTSLKNYEASSAREAVGAILNSIVIMSPKK